MGFSWHLYKLWQKNGTLFPLYYPIRSRTYPLWWPQSYRWRINTKKISSKKCFFCQFFFVKMPTAAYIFFFDKKTENVFFDTERKEKFRFNRNFKLNKNCAICNGSFRSLICIRCDRPRCLREASDDYMI